MSTMNGCGPSNHLELFVRAGQDGESYGGCPFCQRMFMVLLLKANHSDLTFTVTTINLAKPPVEFKRLSSRLPVMTHGSEVLTDEDEMIQYIDEHFPDPPLQYDNKRAAEACREVFSKFSFYIKEVAHSATSLLIELEKLNNFLEQSNHRFICGDTMCHLDCLILPKLQHIRVVSKAFKDFLIPPEYSSLWRYLRNAYTDEVFQKTCPSDQEIVYHWITKPELPLLSKQKKQVYSTEGAPRHSFDVPNGI